MIPTPDMADIEEIKKRLDRIEYLLATNKYQWGFFGHAAEHRSIIDRLRKRHDIK